MTKFEEDLNLLVERLNKSTNVDTQRKLSSLKDDLIHLKQRRLVKINHSIMELVCAKHLILRGYEVKVEHFLNKMSCDIYGVKGFGHLIVEVETGYIPPKYALDPSVYTKSRIASKIARYSGYAEKFCLATPTHNILPIHSALIKPPRYRTSEELNDIKKLCDLYYSNPPVSLEKIRNARLQTIYLLDIDQAVVKETAPSRYIEKVDNWKQ